MNNLKDKLSKITKRDASYPSSKETDARLKPWLRYYSSSIARRILSALEEKGMSQVNLAELLDISPQQVSKIVKGHENLTLESIYNLSNALGLELITFPEYKYSKEGFYAKNELCYAAVISMSDYANLKGSLNQITVNTENKSTVSSNIDKLQKFA